MADPYREFYELAGRCYPEDRLTYSSLSGIIRKKWVINKLKELPSGNLLDCGCNIGRISAEWRKGEVFGVDIAYALLARGKGIYPYINFIQGDLQKIQFLKPNSIDNAIAIEVIEHLTDVDEFLNGIFDIMKKNGMILITTPSYSHKRPTMANLGVLRSFGIKKGVIGEQYLHTAYKPAELKIMLGKAGFTVIETGSFEFELRGWVKPFTMLSRIFESLSERFFPYSHLNRLFVDFLHQFELDTFYILNTLGLGWLLQKLFKEGRRAYVLAKK